VNGKRVDTPDRIGSLLPCLNIFYSQFHMRFSKSSSLQSSGALFTESLFLNLPNGGSELNNFVFQSLQVIRIGFTEIIEFQKQSLHRIATVLLKPLLMNLVTMKSFMEESTIEGSLEKFRKRSAWDFTSCELTLSKFPDIQIPIFVSDGPLLTARWHFA